MIACKSATKQVPSGNNDSCIDFKEFKPQDVNLAAAKHLAWLRLCLSLHETERNEWFLSEKS